MKQFILFLILIVSQMTHAATAVRSYREVIADKVKSEKDRLNEIVDMKSGRPLSQSEYRMITEELVTDLNMTIEKKNSLLIVLATTPNKKAFIQDLLNLVAISKAAVELKGVNSPEAMSLTDAAAAAVSFKTNMAFVGAAPKSPTLNQTQLTKVASVMKKIDSLTAEMLPLFLKSERVAFSQLMNTFDKSLQLGTFQTAEEAFVSAVMTVKKMNKEQALEYIEKMKNCI